jgi:hypothetical protein
MIARIWHGMIPVSEGEEYRDLMRRIALPEYLGRAETVARGVCKARKQT